MNVQTRLTPLRAFQRWIALTLSLAVAIAFFAPRPAQAAGLLVADGPFGGVLEIEQHDVNVTINNGIAVTTVEQVFRNTEDRTVEALYTFPVPQGASIANFSMWINGKEMIGEVLEKQRARDIYESYKQQPKPIDPGLLEQVDYKTFELRIFPILANAEQRIRVTYYQELNFDHDRAVYVYPLATTTRPGINQDTTGRMALRLRVKSEVPITEMTSPSHSNDFVIASHDPHFYEASLETTGGSLARDLVLAYTTKRPHTGIDLITSMPPGEDGYFQATLTAGEELAPLDQAKDYVFVVDISGSMSNDGKLLTSKGSVEAFINGLSPDDRFELITFNVAPNPLFGNLKLADDQAIAQARTYLASTMARGGTNLVPAMETAYRYGDPDRPLVVVVLSDGMTEQHERQQLLQLISQRPANARVFCIGVGNEVNRPLLEQVARDAGGLAAFISQGDDFNQQAQAFRRKLAHAVASDIKVDFGGLNVYDVEPQVLPDLYHGSPIRIYGRYRNGGTGKLTITADAAGQEIQSTGDITLPKTDGGNPEIERMWAWHRIDRLLKEGDRRGSRDSVVEEVVRLGEGYSIVSEYTSFIVLENDGEYERWNIDRRNATRIERDRSARARVNAELDRIRQRATADLGPQRPAPDSPNLQQVADSTPMNRQTTPAAQPQQQRPRRVDIQVNPNSNRSSGGGGGGGGGGGAFGPIGAIGLIGVGAILAFRKREDQA